MITKMRKASNPDAGGDIRTRILAAALHVLHETGVTDLTQPKVAKAAGVTQGHLTYYFPTRNQLLLAVARHSLEALSSQMLESGRRGGLQSIDQIAFAFATAVTDTRRGRVLLGLVIACDEDPGIRDAFRKFIVEIRGMIGHLLGSLGLRNDPDSVAAFHAHAIGLAALNLARNNEASHEEAQRLMLKLLKESPSAHAKENTR